MNIETTERFARICSATNEGMNEGFLFEESLMYFIEKDDAERYAIEIGYASLDEAYDDDAYCCRNCGNTVCDDCSRTCHDCEETVCSNCSYTCDSCGESLCRACHNVVKRG